MAINLKKTDVVIIGLGAVGGVAALPLARAGLEVVGLEAGAWLTPRAFGLDELEPYYDKVEHEVGVSGQAGNINGTIDKRGNIFEGPRARVYPMPALHGTEFTERMAGAARKLGWHPFPGPAAINSQAYDGRAECLYHGFCNRGGCHVSAKNSTAVSTIPKAGAAGKLSVGTPAIATSIDVDERSGRVSRVNY